MSLRTFKQSLGKTRSLWLGLALALCVSHSGNSADYSRVDPMTGVANYYDELFGADNSTESMRSNAGDTNFGPDPSGQRFHEHAGDRSSPPHETYKPNFDPDKLWRSGPTVPSPANPIQPEPDEEPEPTGEELVSLRLTARYGDPVVGDLLRGQALINSPISSWRRAD